MDEKLNEKLQHVARQFSLGHPLTEHDIIFLDCEASGLSNFSYPIEIGWKNGLGIGHNILIKPAIDWSHWDFESEKIHGISRDYLKENGVEFRKAATEIQSHLYGKLVMSDASSFDEFWCNRLFVEANINKGFAVQNIWAFLYDMGIPAENLPTLKQRAKDIAQPTHRTDEDTKYLFIMYEMAKNNLHTPIIW